MKKSADLWVFIGFSLLMMLIYRPALDAKFALADDHEIFRFAAPVQLSPQVGPPLSLGEMIGPIDAENGRVRTVFYIVRFALINLLGTNPFLWHTCFLLLGLVTAALLYATLRTLNVGIVPSLLGIGTIMFLPTVSFVWIRLGAPENVGTLFLCIAFFAIAKSAQSARSTFWDAVLVSSVLAMALTKESFILTIPALIYARLLVSHRSSHTSFMQATTANWLVVALMGVIFGLALGLLYFRVQAAGVASQGGSSFTPNPLFLFRLAGLVADSVWQAAGYVPIILLGLVALRHPNRIASHLHEVSAISVFPILLVVPQVFLYATRDFFDSRYWLPAIIGIVFVNIASLVWLSRYNKWIYLGGVIWLSLGLIVFSRQTAFQVSWFRADTVALNRMLDDITTRTGYHRAVVIAADPGIQYEAAISLLYHIAQRGRADIPVYLLLTPSESDNLYLVETQTKALLETYFVNHNALIDVSPDQVDAIILLSQREDVPLFGADIFSTKLVEYSEPVPTFSFKERTFTTTDAVYKVLWLFSNP